MIFRMTEIQFMTDRKKRLFKTQNKKDVDGV